MSVTRNPVEGNSRMPPEHSEFPSEEFLTRALGFAPRRGGAWRQLAQPDGARSRRRRVQTASVQTVGRCRSGRTDGAARHSSSPPCPLRLASVVRHTTISHHNFALSVMYSVRIWNLVLILVIFSFGCFVPPSYALSARHHLYNAGRNFGQMIWAPIEGVLIRGPEQIHKTYQYEVWGREDAAKRGLLRYKLFALWRAPGEEIKSIIDGAVKSVDSCGGFLKELLSIFFSD